ncbi:MAG: general secretion pathway protein GspB [Pseudomonadota bacterium]
MSLILDALRKSDVERSRQQAPQVAGAASASDEPEEPGRRWLLPVLALLGVNAVLLAWVLLRPQSPAPIETVQSVAASAPAEPAAQSQAGTVNPLPARETEAAAAPPQKAEVRSLVEETSVLNRFQSATRQPEARAADALQTPPATTPAPSTAATNTPPARTEAAEAAALDLPDASELVDGGVMTREALTLELHYYADAADRRLAFIGGQRVSGGDVLSGGIGVVEIVRNGVVLEHRGRRYLLRRN